MLVIIMRHAERGDMSYPQRLSSRPYDPPLSHNANQQILVVSQELRDILINNKCNDLHIVSSPFLRCMMTAEKIAQYLKSEKIGTHISVDAQLCQYLRPDWFEQSPINKLTLSDPEQIGKFLKHKYEWKIEQIQFPENYGMFQKRITNCYEQILSRQNNTLIITHGFCVREICRNGGMLQFSAQIPECGYQVQLHDRSKNKRSVVKCVPYLASKF